MSKRALDPAALRRLVVIVDVILDKLPAVDPIRYAGSAERRKAAEAALDELARTEGAKWRDKGSEVSLSLGGVRASSTMGATAALTNWRASALNKIGGAA